MKTYSLIVLSLWLVMTSSNVLADVFGHLAKATRELKISAKKVHF